MLKALESPIRQIAENAGVEGSIVVGKISDNKSETYGFDAQNEEYVDMTGHQFFESSVTSARAVRSSRASSPDGPTSWTPSGIPPSPVISGMVIAGRPT